MEQSHTVDRTTGARWLATAVVALAVAALWPAAAGAAGCPGAKRIPRASTVDDAATATLCVLNRERARRDLPRLHVNDALEKAGARFARRMVRAQFFSHTAPSGATMADRLRAVGYADPDRAWDIGETLAWGVGRRATPAGTVAAWLASPTHRRLLLDGDFRDVGIGVWTGAPVSDRADGPAATYAAELGVRR